MKIVVMVVKMMIMMLVEEAIPDGIFGAELGDLLFVRLGAASKDQGPGAIVRDKVRPSVEDQSDHFQL